MGDKPGPFPKPRSVTKTVCFSRFEPVISWPFPQHPQTRRKPGQIPPSPFSNPEREEGRAAAHAATGAPCGARDRPAAVSKEEGRAAVEVLGLVDSSPFLNLQDSLPDPTAVLGSSTRRRRSWLLLYALLSSLCLDRSNIGVSLAIVAYGRPQIQPFAPAVLSLSSSRSGADGR